MGGGHHKAGKPAPGHLEGDEGRAVSRDKVAAPRLKGPFFALRQGCESGVREHLADVGHGVVGRGGGLYKVKELPVDGMTGVGGGFGHSFLSPFV